MPVCRHFPSVGTTDIQVTVLGKHLKIIVCSLSELPGAQYFKTRIWQQDHE
jgi:hypothetical protein